MFQLVSRALTIGLLGIAAGLASSQLLARFAESHLFGMTRTDPVTLVAASALLLGVIVLASGVTAVRVDGCPKARVDGFGRAFSDDQQVTTSELSSGSLPAIIPAEGGWVATVLGVSGWLDQNIKGMVVVEGKVFLERTGEIREDVAEPLARYRLSSS